MKRSMSISVWSMLLLLGADASLFALDEPSGPAGWFHEQMDRAVASAKSQ